MGSGDLPGFILMGAAIVFIAIFSAFQSLSAKRRFRRLESWALRHRWTADQKDPLDLRRNLAGFHPLGVPIVDGQSEGTIRHVLRGRLEGVAVTVFEYERDVSWIDLLLVRVPPLWPFFVFRHARRGRPRLFTIAVMEAPLVSPGLRIVPERLRHRASARARREDIQVEDRKFSKRYFVTSDDRRFAYDVLHPRAVEAFLRFPPMGWDWRGHMIVASRQGHLEPRRVGTMLEAVRLMHRHAPRHRIPEQGRWIHVQADPASPGRVRIRSPPPQVSSGRRP